MICSELESRNIRCWIAHRDILPGEDWLNSIIDAVEVAKVIVVVFSANTEGSDWVKDEIKFALDKKIKVIPFRIENVEPKGTLRILKVRCQWLDAFPPPLEKHFNRLVEVVGRHLGLIPEMSIAPDIYRNYFEDNVEYIKIPGGTYKFSVTEKIETVPDLYFCKYLVTNKRYRKFISYLEGKEKSLEETLPLKSYAEKLLELAGTIEDNPGYLGKEPDKWGTLLRSGLDDDKRFNGDDQPVVDVTWYAARAYCFWLSCLQQQEGLYRLPTEVEWEWAAAGREPGGSLRTYPWAARKGELSPELANYDGNVDITTPVGRYPEGATPEGLMDMAGNAWEWMDNWYDEDQNCRVLRGGSWTYQSDYLRCAARYLVDPRTLWNSLGFRVVRVSAPSHEGKIK